MPTTSNQQVLVKLLRQRLTDDRHIRPAFSMALTDRNATDACVEVTNGFLRTDVTNSSVADDLTFDLSDFRYNTIGGLIDAINASEGYTAAAVKDVDRDHPSNDIKIVGYGDLISSTVDFRHRRWADTELLNLVEQGTQQHNMSYTASTVPENEIEFVLSLSHALALKQLATSSVKRVGLSASVGDLTGLAESYERTYREITKRQQRAIPVPTTRDDDVAEGDVVQGEFYRRSGRTGFVAPMAANLPPEPPILLEPSDESVGDTYARLQWARIRDYDFYAVELWRDVTENVVRHRAGQINHAPTAVIRAREASSTSKLVFQTWGANSNFDTVGFATFLEEHGQLITSIIDGEEDRCRRSARVASLPLEPETEYFYRLYVFDLNYEGAQSEVVRIRTKPLRARFDETNGIEPTYGPITGGTAITLRGSNFHEGMLVRIGDKIIPYPNVTIVSPNEATVVSPGLVNTLSENLLQDVSITSKTGLQDIAFQAWKYTPA